jgi:hypothetical protein
MGRKYYLYMTFFCFVAIVLIAEVVDHGK